MPYFVNLEEERKKKDPNQVQQSFQTVNTGSSQAMQSQGPNGPPAPGNPTQGVGSGKFVNFDRIFGANQAVAQNMAQTAQKNIGQTAQNAQNAVQGAQTGFNNAVADAWRGTNPTTTRDKSAEVGKQYGVQEAQYGGPKDFNDYLGADRKDALNQGIDKAKSQLDQTKDAYGLQTYLQSQNQNGNYSNGMSKWDAALLGQAGGEDFARMRNKYANLDALMGDAQRDSYGTVDTAKLGVDQRNDAERNSALAANNSAVEDAAADKAEQDRMNQAYLAWQAALRNGDANADALRKQYYDMQNQYQGRQRQKQADEAKQDPWYQENVAVNDAAPAESPDELTEEQKQENIRKYGNPDGLK